MLSRIGDTWVITRANNREPIEEALAQMDEADQPHFLYVDLPPWSRFWKRGGRGIHAYSLLWQFAALRRARMLQREMAVDVVWHLTLSSVWMGSTGALLGLPFILGPMGGGVSVPLLLAPSLGARGAASEMFRLLVRGTSRFVNPLARMAWRRASLILVQNEETRRWLPASQRSKVTVLPHVVLDPSPQITRDRSGGPPTALFAARLLPWKGGMLALAAIKQLPDWRLLVAGTGSDERRLRREAVRLGVQQQVRFLGWVPRERLLEMMESEVDVMLFPSLREEAGWVVAEATTRGLPVICIARGGPPILGGVAVSPSTRVGTASRLARMLTRAATGDLGHRAPPRLDSDTLRDRVQDLLVRSGLLFSEANGRRKIDKRRDP